MECHCNDVSPRFSILSFTLSFSLSLLVPPCLRVSIYPTRGGHILNLRGVVLMDLTPPILWCWDFAPGKYWKGGGWYSLKSTPNVLCRGGRGGIQPVGNAVIKFPPKIMTKNHRPDRLKFGLAGQSAFHVVGVAESLTRHLSSLLRCDPSKKPKRAVLSPFAWAIAWQRWQISAPGGSRLPPLCVMCSVQRAQTLGNLGSGSQTEYLGGKNVALRVIRGGHILNPPPPGFGVKSID